MHVWYVRICSALLSRKKRFSLADKNDHPLGPAVDVKSYQTEYQNVNPTVHSYWNGLLIIRLKSSIHCYGPLRTAPKGIQVGLIHTKHVRHQPKIRVFSLTFFLKIIILWRRWTDFYEFLYLFFLFLWRIFCNELLHDRSKGFWDVTHS